MKYLLWHAMDAVAETSPDRPACRFEGTELSYGELRKKTTKLARTLHDLGVRRGDRVGILMGKGLETLVAVHGILKAGAAFVPIDPTAPAERVRFILRDCDIKVLVSEDPRRRVLSKALAEETPLDVVIGLPEPGDLPIRALPWTVVMLASGGAPELAATELDLAYIMYTSGSSGEPKGLMHTHQSGLAYARLAKRAYGVTSEDRVSGFAPLHVDQSTFACFTAPLAGATVVMVPEEAAAFPAQLAKLIADERITIWYSVPLALIQLADRGELDEHDGSSLRWVTYGGEPFPPKQLKALASHWPQAKFSNVYGPAEVNQCTHFDFGVDELRGGEPVPIGDAWPNTELLVADESDEAVADGVVGELLVRSPTMMRGYWRRPDLDEKAFYVREEHPSFPERFYRTGDLVRRREDGLLEFVGRKDRQIKVRGYRVELDEVEAALAAHEAVREAAAFVDGDAPDNRRIVAAVLLNDDESAESNDLVKFAARTLPKYAVPENVSVEEDFPRTGGGKIDRRALAATLKSRDSS